MTIEFGKLAEDKISNFKGFVTGRASYITGCDQYLLQPRCPHGDRDKLPEGKWFDEQRLSVLAEAPLQLDNSKGNGADLAAPVK